MNATVMMVAIFPTSEGWNWTNPKSIHRFAPPAAIPIISTTTSSIHEMGSSTMNVLNHLQGMLCTIHTTHAPTSSMVRWLVIGAQWSPLLKDRLLDALNTSMTEIRHRNRKIIQIALSPLKKFFSRSISK